MELIENLNLVNDKLEFNYYGNNLINSMSNIDRHTSSIYKFKNLTKETENDRFIIEYSGNILDDEKINVAHYILLKKGEKLNYLIKVEIFDYRFEIES